MAGLPRSPSWQRSPADRDARSKKPRGRRSPALIHRLPSPDDQPPIVTDVTTLTSSENAFAETIVLAEPRRAAARVAPHRCPGRAISPSTSRRGQYT